VANKCPKCETNNPDTQQFCGDCGTQLPTSEEVSPSLTKTLQTPVKDLIKGMTFAGRYQIIEELGRGGMGVVFKAEDAKLKRTVALKFLPPELTHIPDVKDRFMREAQAAALNHPHICTIYEIDEADEQTFISMEYIKGQSLKDKLESGPLAIDEAKDIALQVAAGLEKAHKKGIVHRDIKPANIMINDEGQPKITDFGLAKLSWEVDLTKPATIMGTVAYMSPEQAKGEKVDHRTDIWSLGAMLYEMLTGERPFKKDKEQALIYAILNDTPTPLSLLRSDVPNHVEQVIEKAMVKKASERYQNIQELTQDLKLSITSPKTEKSIVVLPFDDMSPGKDNEYFSDGLSEEIISDLSLIHDLLVISRSSAMTYKGTKKKIKEIGKELNVQYVLEGSVRKAGNNLRITAQLIDAINDTHLWANKYSGTLDDVFDIQEKVSRSIVDALTMKLSPEEDHKLAKRPIKNMQAYECYLRARQDIYTFTKEGLDRAVRYLQDGLEIIGENAVIYAGLGYAYSQYVNIGLEHEEYVNKAENYARKALALDPESLEAHFVQGFVNLLFYGKPKKAINHAKRALAIFPDDPDVLFWLTAGYGTNWGKPKEARQTYNRLLKVDPLNPLAFCGWLLDVMAEGRLDLSVDYLTKWFQKEPQLPVALFFTAQFLAYCHHFKEASALVSENAQLDMEDVFTKLSLFVKYAIEGDKKRIKELLTVDFVKTTRRDAQNSYFVTGLLALSGMKDEAFDWLENSVDRGFFNYPFISKYDPFLENIRSEPRFKKLMERVKHEWENFEV
jgi:serine/threonine protein kinase/tetratricopeptide (TPR) repeat protein